MNGVSVRGKGSPKPSSLALEGGDDVVTLRRTASAAASVEAARRRTVGCRRIGRTELRVLYAGIFVGAVHASPETPPIDKHSLRG